MLHRVKSQILTALPGFAQRSMMSRRFNRRPFRGEPEVLELPKIVRRGDVALDVGANIGMYSYALSRLAQKVVVFEPNPALARRLRALGLANVEVRELALSSSQGRATLTMPDWPDGHGYGTLRAEQLPKNTTFKTMSVEMCTLDSLALPAVDFIKIDVEGIEEEVIEGAMETIRRHRPAILVELVDKFNPGTHARVNACLAELDYSGFFLLGDWRPFSEFDLAKHHDRTELKELRDVPRGEWGYINNFLFLPAGRTIGH